MGFSPDASLLLFATEVQNIWRHSFTARYLIFDPVKNSTQEVLGKGGVDRLQYCDWVERDNSNKNALVLVYENNLYWREDFSMILKTTLLFPLMVRWTRCSMGFLTGFMRRKYS